MDQRMYSQTCLHDGQKAIIRRRPTLRKLLRCMRILYRAQLKCKYQIARRHNANRARSLVRKQCEGRQWWRSKNDLRTWKLSQACEFKLKILVSAHWESEVIQDMLIRWDLLVKSPRGIICPKKHDNSSKHVSIASYHAWDTGFQDLWPLGSEVKNQMKCFRWSFNTWVSQIKVKIRVSNRGWHKFVCVTAPCGSAYRDSVSIALSHLMSCFGSMDWLVSGWGPHSTAPLMRRFTEHAHLRHRFTVSNCQMARFVSVKCHIPPR